MTFNWYEYMQHFQKDLIRGCQGVVSVSSKQMDIGKQVFALTIYFVPTRIHIRESFISVVRKLAEDCCKYGTKEECSTSPLAEVAFQVGTSHTLMENQREIFLGILSNKVNLTIHNLRKDLIVIFRGKLV